MTSCSRSPLFRPDLLAKYAIPGPRYTSYPTALQFDEAFDPGHYARAAADPGAAASELSLYVHIPFCATACFYCGCNRIATGNRSHAVPYLERLKRELALQAERFDPDRVITQLHWGGGTPTFLSDAQTAELMAATRACFPIAADDEAEISIEIDPRTAVPATLAHLRMQGFNRLSLGVQDVDAEVQRSINRVQPIERTASLIAAARLVGYRSISVDLIYGLPRQSVATFARTLDTVIELAPDRISVFGYAHLPQLFKMQRRIDEAQLPPPAERVALLGLAIEMLTEAGYVYIGMDHFARPGDELVAAQRNGTLQRNFQGYSTRADTDLIGVGVSSIGKVGDVYAQNAKDLAAWGAALDAGRLPIARGVRLSVDDRLRRDVIMRLMCNLTLPFAELEAAYGIRFAERFTRELEALGEFERDGLLTIEPDRLTIHPVGRLFVRNIAMAFDAYLSTASAGRCSRTV
ncbi:oxygen-independent coproporphyrinogen III oxidase [Burkholderia glumae]|uniref:oxygen-independent coproporphyrinogen III oxidase n=1 Tax=Burkholderia glumae TaxID=337 RepID=UPI0003792958|nr:oxygen-independent coproporphyrinogen III oxidase [Burkholderia glumae]PJO23743.1 oxygen-independent coproporphyrinogen III oxidase [Burkholderia glumae AU6208]QHE09866.1 oxygen-independent coproporphyrinogen III oxidase [Burkholderia glumae AU6208]